VRLQVYDFKNIRTVLRLTGSIITIFSGRNLRYYLLAIVLTMLVVENGFDGAYYRLTRVEWIVHFARPAIILGTLVPVVETLVILAFGVIRKNPRIITMDWALGQAALLGHAFNVFEGA
jgi:hypothetical protein